MGRTLKLERKKQPLAIVRLEATEPIPDWAVAQQSEFFSITRTNDELSIVCDVRLVPTDVTAERDWVALKIAGPLAFDEVGIIATLATTLQRACVPIFVVSTYDTDYVLIRNVDMDTAAEALERAGHTVRWK